MKCSHCGQKPVNKCDSEGFDCTGGMIDSSFYSLKENQIYQNVSDEMRAAHGNSLTRLEEIVEFYERAGFSRLGVAFCIGLAEEAHFIGSVLQKKFKVDSSSVRLENCIN